MPKLTTDERPVTGVPAASPETALEHFERLLEFETDCWDVHTAVAAGMIPVIAPIGAGADGATYNINADTMAGAIAAALGAARLFLLTDVAGVLDKSGRLLTALTPADIARLKADGTIAGGMIPKLETCIHAVEAGCEAAVVLDGRVPHAMLLEIFTSQGAGTLIRA